MSKKVKIKKSKISVLRSKSINIGNISEKTRGTGGEKASLIHETKKMGKTEKIIAIIFMICLISLVIVLKALF